MHGAGMGARYQLPPTAREPVSAMTSATRKQINRVGDAARPADRVAGNKLAAQSGHHKMRGCR